MSSEVVLEARALSRAFTGVLALQQVDFRLFAGEIHALMGQNGAGKSTLIKLLTGVYAPDSGELCLQGRVVQPATPAAAQQLGISTVYQEVNLCPNLSVAENIFAGRYPRKGAAGLWRIDWQRMQADARALLARLHLDIDVTRLLSSYSVAVQQMVAIARALSVKARVLILDEPTSSLDEEEVQRLFEVMRRLRDEGMAILFVTHFLQQMYAVCDRITVLRNGERVGEYLKAELPPQALIRAMVGRELGEAVGKAGARDAAGTVPEDAPPLLQATGLGRRGQLRPLDLTLRRGEVVGVGGLLGSGRTELARLLFGLDRADSGELRLAGVPLRLTSPAQAIRHGLALCPEERKVEGIVGELSVRENLVLALQARQGVWRALSRTQQDEIATRFIQLLGIKTADSETPIARLSGGNQQKAVLGRWLATEPTLLILDEPTRGIDVAAKQDIMNRILDLARGGLAVLFISSEMDEVVRVSDRIVVLRDRSKVGELPGDSSEHAVYQLIAAGS
ncbi:sugar ABC transporter ATP-binding protein [Aquabacterium sp.]|uniref:sugar ABC transporter ATP-binding protein n=1 Tax=Aquabacterium sp. TaxID=1872578 RepID=UPI002C85E7BC|nr:sugar ABC transporter ATP-binding protein [Aquabacterium sp.]HSW03810.1 sugar ABC transporter ATP-binding protein [Aquabacterium sp.]